MYMRFLQGATLKAEQVLEQTRPADKPDRNDTVKLFDSFEAARQYWVLDKNSKIYQVNILPEEIRHKGNYTMYKQIVQAEDEEQILLAQSYWEDTEDENVIIENCVDSAEVVAIICAREDIRENTKRYLFSNNSVPGLGVLDENGEIFYPDIERDE